MNKQTQIIQHVIIMTSCIYLDQSSVDNNLFCDNSSVQMELVCIYTHFSLGSIDNGIHVYIAAVNIDITFFRRYKDYVLCFRLGFVDIEVYISFRNNKTGCPESCSVKRYPILNIYILIKFNLITSVILVGRIDIPVCSDIAVCLYLFMNRRSYIRHIYGFCLIITGCNILAAFHIRCSQCYTFC